MVGTDVRTTAGGRTKGMVVESNEEAGERVGEGNLEEADDVREAFTTVVVVGIAGATPGGKVKRVVMEGREKAGNVAFATEGISGVITGAEVIGAAME